MFYEHLITIFCESRLSNVAFKTFVEGHIIPDNEVINNKTDPRGGSNNPMAYQKESPRSCCPRAGNNIASFYSLYPGQTDLGELKVNTLLIFH